MPETRPSRHAPAPRLRRETAGLLLLFLAAIDAVGTLLVLRAGRAQELNPLVDWLWTQGELPYLAIKLAVTAGALAWLLRRGEARHVRLGLLAGFAIYVPVTALHVVNSLVALRIVQG